MKRAFFLKPRNICLIPLSLLFFMAPGNVLYGAAGKRGLSEEDRERSALSRKRHHAAQESLILTAAEEAMIAKDMILSAAKIGSSRASSVEETRKAAILKECSVTAEELAALEEPASASSSSSSPFPLGRSALLPALVPAQTTQRKLTPTSQLDGIHIRSLTTFQEHRDHLLSIIGGAKRKLLITSLTFSADFFSDPSLFEAIHVAACRGVRIYLYFQKKKVGDKNAEELNARYLTYAKITQRTLPMHAKMLSADDQSLTCGPFNWLASSQDQQYDKNASLVLEGENVAHLMKDAWTVLNSYTGLAYHPKSLPGIARNLEKRDSIVWYDDKRPGEECELLLTPQHHDSFFLECFEKAKNKITACCPFITKSPRYLQGILPLDTIGSFFERGKILQIFYRANDENFRILQQHLAPFSHNPNLTFTPIKNLHRKTFIVDNHLYLEGSFNLTSSARDLEDDFALMEASLALSGAQAKLFIDAFYESASHW